MGTNQNSNLHMHTNANMSIAHVGGCGAGWNRMSKCGEAWDGGKEWSPAVINSGAGFEVHQFIFIGFYEKPFQEFSLVPGCFIGKDPSVGKYK